MTVQDYEEALAEANEVGASNASDAGTMAQFCDSNIQILCGAVAPKLVWEGAQKAGRTFKELTLLAGTDPVAVAELMWVE